MTASLFNSFSRCVLASTALTVLMGVSNTPPPAKQIVVSQTNETKKSVVSRLNLENIVVVDAKSEPENSNNGFHWPSLSEVMKSVFNETLTPEEEKAYSGVKDKRGRRAFTLEQAIKLKRSGVTPEDALAYSVITCDFLDVIALKYGKVTFDEAIAYSSIKNEEGGNFYSAPTIVLMKSNNFSPESAREFTRIIDDRGRPAYTTDDMSFYLSDKESSIKDLSLPELIELAEGFSRITDNEGRTIYTLNMISDLRKANISSSTARDFINSISDVKDAYGNCVILKNEDFRKLITKSWNKKEDPLSSVEKFSIFVEKFSRVVNRKGIVFDGSDVRKIFLDEDTRSIGDRLGYANDVASIICEGESVFNGEDIVSLLEFKVSYDFVNQYAKNVFSLKKDNGEHIFRSKDITDLLISRVPLDVALYYTERLANIKCTDGTYAFDGTSISGIVALGVSSEDIDNFVATGFNGDNIYRLSFLGISAEEAANFKDTKKPNAIIIYPKSDYNHAFRGNGARDFFTRLKSGYDVFVRVAETDFDIESIIGKIPKVELLVLSGHGDAEGLMLGKDSFFDLFEEYAVDLSDTTQIATWMNQLEPNATIFLDSCSNAATRTGGNLATTFASCAGHRRVIASRQIFYQDHVTVDTVYPLDLTIMARNHSGVLEDATFTNY